MRKIIAILMSLVILCLSGCVAQELPKGVCEHGDKEYYRIMLPKGKSVDDQFELTESWNIVVVSSFSESGAHQGNVSVYFQKETQGGWVAYSGNKTGLILYFSSGFDAKEVKIACTALTRSKENYMSWDEAKNYIHWLE